MIAKTVLFYIKFEQLIWNRGFNEHEKAITSFFTAILIFMLLSSCGTATTFPKMENHMTQEERNSVVWGELSPEHIYYL